MKNLLGIIVVVSAMTFLTSCINERDIKEIQQRAAKQAETYDLVDTDRVVDAYFKKFRIAAPKGTVLELDERSDLCYKDVSGEQKSSANEGSVNADNQKQDKDGE